MPYPGGPIDFDTDRLSASDVEFLRRTLVRTPEPHALGPYYERDGPPVPIDFKLSPEYHDMSDRLEAGEDGVVALYDDILSEMEKRSTGSTAREYFRARIQELADRRYELRARNDREGHRMVDLRNHELER